MHIDPLQQLIKALSQSLLRPHDPTLQEPSERELYVIVLPHTDKVMGQGKDKSGSTLFSMNSPFSRLFVTAVVTAGNPLIGN